MIILKLIIAIVHDEDSGRIIDEFNDNNLKITKMCSTGGFMKSGNSTLLSGIQDDEVDKAVSIIENNTRKREDVIDIHSYKVSTGRATIFIADIERCEKF